MLKPLLFTGLFIIATAFAQAQSPQSHAPQASSGRVVTRTRLVALYSDLEDNLMVAVQKKDRSGVEKLMSDDCPTWTPLPPGRPMPREEWISMAFGSDLVRYVIRQMSVKAVGTTNVAAFVLTETLRRDGKEHEGTYWVVDVWDSSNEQQKLVSRYVSQVHAATATQTKPTGKE